MRSAREKLDDVNNQALASDADMVILSETWFYQDRNFLLADFELITQKDRANTKDGHSGGVAIYVRRNIADFFQELCLKSTYTKGIDDVQICAVKSEALNKRIFGIYRSPNIESPDDTKMIEKLYNVGFKEEDVIVGDFNLPSIDWNSLTTKNKRHREYMNLFTSFGMDQLVRQRTHKKDGILDLVYVNMDYTTVYECQVDESIKLNTDHFPIITKLKINGFNIRNKQVHKYKYVIDWKKADPEGYTREMESFSENMERFIGDGTSPELAAIKVATELQRIYDDFHPTIKVRVRSPAEKSAKLQKAINRVRTLRARGASKTERTQASMELKMETKRDKDRRADETFKKILKDNGYLWKAVNDDKRGEERIGPLRKKDGQVVVSNKESCNVLNEHYASITTNTSPWPNLGIENPQGWTQERLRTIIERQRGYEFYGRHSNKHVKKLNNSLKFAMSEYPFNLEMKENVFAENKDLIKANYVWNLPPMDGTRYCTQSSYNFNIKPVSFGVGIHKDVIWNAGEIYSESEYLDYYGRADINTEYMYRMATKKWMEMNTYYDHVMKVFKKVSEAPFDIKWKKLDRLEKSRRVSFIGIDDGRRVNIVSEENLVYPDEYPDWWYRSETHKSKLKHKEYYGFNRVDLEDVKTSRLDNHALSYPMMNNLRSKLDESTKLDERTKLAIWNDAKVDFMNKLERRKVHDRLTFTLDFNKGLLDPTDCDDIDHPERQPDWGRPELKRFGEEKEVPNPEWWSPPLKAPLPPGSYITEQILIDAIGNMNKKSAPGYDGMFPQVITNAGAGINGALLRVFNACLAKGIMPKVWKLAWIKALRKPGGDPRDPNNTRPISILPTLGKLFETCVGMLEEKFSEGWLKGSTRSRLLPRSQSGFKKGSSCADNLAETLHKIIHALDEDQWIDMISFDFKKAFDSTTFGHILEDKLQNGLQGTEQFWESYHDNRLQFVKIGEESSTFMQAHGGNPQGAPRSPPHFSEYIRSMYVTDEYNVELENSSFGDSENGKKWSNDFFNRYHVNNKGETVETLKSKRNRAFRHIMLNFYADDAKCMATVGRKEDTIVRKGVKISIPQITFGDLQSKINTMEEICLKRGLSFHPKKCNVMHFGYGNPKLDYFMTDTTTGERVKLEKVTQVRDLGLWYGVDKDGRVTTKVMFQRVINKMKCMARLLKRILKGQPLEKYTLAYHCLLKCNLCFCSEMWYEDTVEQHKELYSIYRNYFSDIAIPKDLNEIVLPETPVAFLKKLHISRMFKICRGWTNLEPKKYFQFKCPHGTKIDVNSTGKKMHCWCCYLSKLYKTVDKKYKLYPDKLKEYFEEGQFEDAYGLRNRGYIYMGGRQYAKKELDLKIKYYKKNKEFQSFKNDQTRIQALVEIENELKQLKPTGRIINKVDSMTEQELRRLDGKVKKKTKTMKEKMDLVGQILKRKYGLEYDDVFEL